MINLRRITIVSMMFGLLASALAVAAPAEASPASDRAAIRKLEVAGNKAFLAHNWTLACSYLSPKVKAEVIANSSRMYAKKFKNCSAAFAWDWAHSTSSQKAQDDANSRRTIRNINKYRIRLGLGYDGNLVYDATMFVGPGAEYHYSKIGGRWYIGERSPSFTG